MIGAANRVGTFSLAFVLGVGFFDGAQDRASDVEPTAVSGTVRAADSGLVLRDAEVRLSGGGLKSPRSVFTDDQGRYRFDGVVPGRYFLAASKLGYVEAGYGKGVSLGEPKPLVVEGPGLESIDFRLLRAGVIVANVTDQAGEPVAGAILNVYRISARGGTRRLVSVESNGFITHTNDRGEARLFNLPPGSYYLSARMFPNPFLTGRPKTAEVFYPGTLSERDAQLIEVASGQEVQATFYFVNARLARVVGTVLTAAGAPYPSPNLQLLSVTGAGVATHSIAHSGSGSFVASAVPPGNYLLQVRPGVGSPDEYANQELQVVGDDIEGLLIQTSPPATIHGRILFDETDVSPKPVVGAFRLAARFVGHSVSPGRLSIARNWTFEAAGILGRGTFVVEDRTNTWFLESVRLDGNDVTERTLDFKALDKKVVELTMTRRPTTVVGLVVGQDNAPIADYAVVAFSEDREQWSLPRRVMTARPDQHGRFKLTGLVPGEYHIAAVRQLEEGRELNAEFLETLRALATRLALERHSSTSVQLVLQE